MKLRIAILTILAFGLAVVGGTASANDATQTKRRVAITIDDIPMSGIGIGNACDASKLNAFNRRLLGSFAAARIHVTGFVNEGIVCERARDELLAPILTQWINRGHSLGNHGLSHLDLNTTPVEDYIADIERGAWVSTRVLGHHPAYFRFPMLHSGRDPGSKQAVAQFLSSQGYRIAPVTIDNQEWLFARLYQRAIDGGDHATRSRVKAAYVPYMESVVAFFETRSHEILGREPAQILLLHANELNVEMLPELTTMLRRRGYQIVSLKDALRDPAYALPDDYVGPRGLSWIHRWGLGRGFKVVEEPREPEWIVKLLEGDS